VIYADRVRAWVVVKPEYILTPKGEEDSLKKKIGAVKEKRARTVERRPRKPAQSDYLI
jgi:hypothetical protein